MSNMQYEMNFEENQPEKKRTLAEYIKEATEKGWLFEYHSAVAEATVNQINKEFGPGTAAYRPAQDERGRQGFRIYFP